ncbi:hypothetical protein CQA53_04835 [Helicobacter didelphidarum]|uniref:Uncharacterized protein n=1 Tax=Helicobacter didelphidarum TaxID=2040648 RepID=A0A3D8INB8_9HELI|nr:hypothetical protein [Helicobacter didelphidarum]RDU66124.1 hypothetical protein CQA53_04835 [Helicobacter didelphidarum]
MIGVMQGTRVAYADDLKFLQSQWKLTLNENHQSVASFVESFCKGAGCGGFFILLIFILHLLNNLTFLFYAFKILMLRNCIHRKRVLA